jgi:protein gp37
MDAAVSRDEKDQAMSDNTKIEWARSSWNPVTGCTAISEGCIHCYAMRMANRLRGRYGYPLDNPFKVTFHMGKLKQPSRWKRPRHVFVCSMGDLFHEDVPFEWIVEVWATMTRRIIPGPNVPKHRRRDYNHTYLLLTKRPQRVLDFIKWNQKQSDKWDAARGNIKRCIFPSKLWPKWIWLGISAENQKRYNERWAIAKQIPAAVKFISAEPLLGPIEIDPEDHPDWIIVGGETGLKARPMHKSWVKSISQQCTAAGVPYFFKKWGDVTGPAMSRELNCLEALELERREFPMEES